MGLFHEYDSNKVSVLAGVNIISGFGPDTKVKAAYNEDLYTLQMGTEGDATRSKSNNLSGRATLTLMQTSKSNDVLSLYYQLDKLGNGGKFTFQIQDHNGLSLVFMNTAWIVVPPESEWAIEAGVREWIIETGHMEMNVAGT